jgi:predicted enzyme related to lactoylglutathione lyase
MKRSGKLDYLEMPATGGTLDNLKAFYSSAFAWSFTDYGPTYSAFAEGLDGGFQADAVEAPTKPLPVLYSENLEETLSAIESAGGRIARPIFLFPGGRRFHFVDPAGNELAVWGE